jgi:hypothetical protein
MNKKIKIILSVLLIIAILAFIIFKVIEFKKEKEENLNFIAIQDFIERKMDGKTILENQDIGLSFVLPQGWEFVTTSWANVSMRTFDFEPFMGDVTRSPMADKGCWIDFNFSINTMDGLDYKYVYNLANIDGYAEDANTEKSIYERIKVNNLKAIKHIYALNDQGESISIQIPFEKNKVYSFETYLVGQDKEKCLEEFNSFLNSVSIK